MEKSATMSRLAAQKLLVVADINRGAFFMRAIGNLNGWRLFIYVQKPMAGEWKAAIAARNGGTLEQQDLNGNGVPALPL